ncbi:hypothetical protein FRC12_019410 [Ceratobasidium sp. 428]|nr:hypothetical protein FRC12_019410 [Ceratobasidium sp. 428]
MMSQTLAAIANGQTVTLPGPDALDEPPFSPSKTAVLVHLLWLLSLSLSIAVSLVAMLAKDWCYKFLSSRVGPSYEHIRGNLDSRKESQVICYSFQLFVFFLTLLKSPRFFVALSTRLFVIAA